MYSFVRNMNFIHHVTYNMQLVSMIIENTIQKQGRKERMGRNWNEGETSSTRKKMAENFNIISREA